MVIGITGTLGAGKGAVVDYLKHKGFIHFSVRDFFAERMKEEGIEINRDNMIDFANHLRETYGPSYVFQELYDTASVLEVPVIIESIRALGEAQALKENGGILLSIDADQAVRYKRISGRGSSLDSVTYEEFKAQEEREMHSEDINKQNIAQVMTMADFALINNTSKEDLHIQIEEVLKRIGM